MQSASEGFVVLGTGKSNWTLAGLCGMIRLRIICDRGIVFLARPLRTSVGEVRSGFVLIIDRVVMKLLLAEYVSWGDVTVVFSQGTLGDGWKTGVTCCGRVVMNICASHLCYGGTILGRGNTTELTEVGTRSESRSCTMWSLQCARWSCPLEANRDICSQLQGNQWDAVEWLESCTSQCSSGELVHYV